MSFVIVSHSSWCFVFDLHSLCRVRIIEWSVQTSKRLSLLSNDHKTIKFFQIEFLNFISRLKFLFRTQLVHAKTTFSCDRKYYKKRDDDRWWWSTNDMTRFAFFSKRNCFYIFRFYSSIFLFSSNFCVLFIVIIISCLSRWNYCATCSWAVYCEKVHAFLKMLCFLLLIVLYQCLFREIDVVVVCLSFVEMSEL